MNIENMKCGYFTEPQDIQRDDICFSWNTKGAEDQKGYRLQIAHDEYFKSVHVDTQKIESQNNLFIKAKAKFSKNTKYYWRVKVYAQSSSDIWSETKSFTTKHGKFEAKWITSKKRRDSQSQAPATRFKKEFNIDKEFQSARLFVSAQGLYTAKMNGEKCGDEYLTPGWTEYRARIQYQVFDVSGLIKIGDNCLSAVVCDGWFMGPLAGWEGDVRCKFGEKRALFAQLEISYNDGTQDVIVTDKSWHSDMNGPYTRCEIYYGADYDSRLDDGFDEPGLKGSANVEEIRIEGKLVPTQSVAVKQVNVLTPIDIITTPKGETVVDMGQNMVGILELTLQGRLGQEIELVHFEILDKQGNVFTSNLRSARQGLNYILKDGINVFKPEMTFYGFRYIHVKKWPGEIKKDNIKGIVLSSDMKRTGYLETNNKMVNQLVCNTLWGQLGNYVDVPTDCPQRDERLGWTGDAHVFIKAAAFNFDVLSFFDKWLADVSHSQRKDGSIPHVVPNVLPDNCSSSGWGECCVIIPWQIYLRYGDIQTLKRCYPMMESFMEYLSTQGTQEYLRNIGFHFGDWLAMDKSINMTWGVTPKDLIATAFYGYCAKLMIKSAKVLGKKGDAQKYKKLSNNIKNAFKKEFVTQTGRLSGHTQTSYVLALEFDMLDDMAKKRAIAELVKLIDECGCITCGFMGSPYVLDVLSNNGHHDLAIDLALRTTYPSWLYPITMGATTIWEHWNSLLPDGSVNPDEMNSFNHYAYGAVINWYYENIAGIIPDEKAPGYKHFFLRPKPCKKLHTIDCKLKTHFGTIRMSYKMIDDNIVMNINIPDNSSAHLCLDDCKAYMINSKRKRCKEDIVLSSGKYEISYVKSGSVMSFVSMEK